MDTQHLSSLFELLQIPSISTLPEHRPDMQRAVDFLIQKLKKLGFSCETFQAQKHPQGNPILFAERVSNVDSPTVLIYGHYDVQPADPLEEWVTPPFEPAVRDGNIYARGATDDKGQLYTHIAALEDLAVEWGDSWPLNFKIVFEGEEEMGSEGISAWVQEPAVQEKLKADFCVISDTGFLSADQPAIEYGLRGLTYMQVDVKLSEQDLHSGLYGGGVLNPAHALVEILNELYDAKTGKVLVPGFYDQVKELTSDERTDLSKLPHDDHEWLKLAGQAQSTFGEEGYTTLERTTARPTLEINGIWGGFQGEGQKTIIPAEAHAKISCRLVADQDPEDIAQKVTSYIKKIAPEAIAVSTKVMSTGYPSLSDRHSRWMNNAVQALASEFEVTPLFARSGGSIPVVASLQRFLGVESIMLGYGLPDDNLHAPNEKMAMSQFVKGIECNKRFYRLCAQEE